MVLHANAALSLKKRLVLCQRVVEQEWTLTKAAEAAEVSVRTARKWVRRYRAEGEAGLGDRPSTPTRQPTRTSEQRVQAIAALRRAAQAGRLRQRRVLLLSCARSPIRPPTPDSPRSHAFPAAVALCAEFALRNGRSVDTPVWIDAYLTTARAT